MNNIEKILINSENNLDTVKYLENKIYKPLFISLGIIIGILIWIFIFLILRH